MPLTVILLSSAICAVLLDIIFHSPQWPGWLVVMLHLTLVVGGIRLWSMQRSKTHGSIVPLIWLLLSLTVSPWLVVRDSSWLLGLNLLTCIGLISLFWVNAFARGGSVLMLSLTTPFYIFIESLTKCTQPLKEALRRFTWLRRFNSTSLRTALLALPVVLIIYALLYSADAVFQQYSDNLFDLTSVWQYRGHLFVVVYLIWFCGLFYSLARKREVTPANAVQLVLGYKSVFRLIAILTAVLLFVFSWIQIRYLFLNSAGLEALGISYQTYAHQGFYQLMVVAALVFTTLWLLGADQATPSPDATADTPTAPIDTLLHRQDKGIAMVLLIEIAILLVSAMTRVWLFATELEWAPRRFFAFEGMIFFLVMLLIFTAHLFIKHFTRQHFLICFTVLFTLNLGLLNLINPDQIIARQNVNRYVVEGGQENELDFDYSAYVSADGVTEGLLLFDHARTPAEKTRAATRLYDAWQDLQHYHLLREDHWYTWHLSKDRAYNLLQTRIQDIRDEL